MKKIFFLILISFSVIFISINDVSCSCDKNQSPRVKINLETMQFTQSTAISNEELWASIYYQISKQAKPQVDENIIRQDSELVILLKDENNNIVENNTDPTNQSIYNIYITISDVDVYFLSMQNTHYTISVIPGFKTDLASYIFTDIHAMNGNEIFNEIINQLSIQAGTTSSNINEDVLNDNIVIIFIDSQNNQINTTSPSYEQGNCTINLEVAINDKYFEQLSPKNYSVIAMYLPDISSKIFTPVKAIIASDLYIAVRTQIGSWANPIISDATIKSDSTIKINIWTKFNPPSHIDDSQSESLSAADYTVKIEISSDCIYFRSMAETDYIIKVTH